MYMATPSYPTWFLIDKIKYIFSKYSYLRFSVVAQKLGYLKTSQQNDIGYSMSPENARSRTCINKSAIQSR